VRLFLPPAPKTAVLGGYQMPSPNQSWVVLFKKRTSGSGSHSIKKIIGCSWGQSLSSVYFFKRKKNGTSGFGFHFKK
jgi:hypothetical protein